MSKIVACLALAALCLTAASADEHTAESYITIHNQTAVSVWITAYGPSITGSRIAGSWAVPAHASNTHGLRINVSGVRAEINAHYCSGANRMDSQLSPRHEGRSHDVDIFRLTGYVRHAGSTCTFTT